METDIPIRSIRLREFHPVVVNEAGLIGMYGAVKERESAWNERRNV